MVKTNASIAWIHAQHSIDQNKGQGGGGQNTFLGFVLFWGCHASDDPRPPGRARLRPRIQHGNAPNQPEHREAAVRPNGAPISGCESQTFK